MRLKVSRSMAIALVAAIGGCGLFGPLKEKDIRYSADENLIPLRAVENGGDFGLFYAGRDKTEVPVRIESGDSVGFIQTEDGRMKAVAGPFKMDLNPAVREAYWKRLSHAEE